MEKISEVIFYTSLALQGFDNLRPKEEDGRCVQFTARLNVSLTDIEQRYASVLPKYTQNIMPTKYFSTLALVHVIKSYY